MEGCEALLPGVDALVERCAAGGVRRIEVGMAHRGRLSLLCNLLHKPPGALFAQMENGQSDYRVGDVKYHLGDTATLAFGKVSLHAEPNWYQDHTEIGDLYASHGTNLSAAMHACQTL